MKKLSGLPLILLLCVAFGASAAAEPPIDIDDQVGLAAAIFRPAPQYSGMALQLKLQGKVGLGVYVDKTGSVYDTIISFGNPLLVELAVDAVKRWKFKPFLNGDGQPAKAMLHVTFDLEPPAKHK